MKIAVVNGTAKRGVTYRLKELFLQPFRGKAEILEFYLPADLPAFCCGCMRCFLEGEEACKDFGTVAKIRGALDEADLLVFTSPAYAMHTTGAMKAFLDHMAVNFIAHRPLPSMFSKRAVIITQCLGAGARAAAKDVKDSLSWWGISRIGIYRGALYGDVVWENLSVKRRSKLERGVRRLARRFSAFDYSRPARTNLGVKFRFFACRLVQKSVYRKGIASRDAEYWNERGWLKKERPYRIKRRGLAD